MYDYFLPQMVEKDYGVWVHSRPLPAKRIGQKTMSLSPICTSWYDVSLAVGVRIKAGI